MSKPARWVRMAYIAASSLPMENPLAEASLNSLSWPEWMAGTS